MARDFVETSQDTLNKLIEAKVKLHDNQRILEEKIEKLQSQCVSQSQ